MIGPLLAVDPTWTDKEVILILGGFITALIPVTWGLAQFLGRSARKENNRLRSYIRDLEEGDKEGELRLVEVKLRHAEEERDAAQDRVNEVTVERDEARATADKHYKEAETLRADRDRLDMEVTTAREELRGEQQRIKKAVQRDGAIWEDRVLARNAVRFEKLDPEVRRMPVISMLNLKGGVGKTTATANLGSALAHLGYRVLLIDLDLQGSLTGMFLSDQEQKQAYDAKRLVGDFFDAAFDATVFEAEERNLLSYAVPISGFPTKSMLVPTTDSQAYAEANLTVRWFLRDTNRDPRFLLRKQLQYARVTNKFDIVLLDCPPLINVSCVNALAASDYVFIPVMPTAHATTRVPVLLQRIRDFHDNLNPDLRVMGVFANRTRGSELTADEQNKLSLIRAKALDTMGAQVPVFNSFIRQSAEFRDVEDERRTLGPDDPMFQPFLSLAHEVIAHLPMFCRQPSSTKPATAGVLS